MGNGGRFTISAAAAALALAGIGVHRRRRRTGGRRPTVPDADSPGSRRGSTARPS